MAKKTGGDVLDTWESIGIHPEAVAALERPLKVLDLVKKVLRL